MKLLAAALLASSSAFAQTTTSLASLSSLVGQPSTAAVTTVASSSAASSTSASSTITSVAPEYSGTGPLNSSPTSVPSNVTVGLLTTPVPDANLTLNTYNLTTGGYVNYFHRTNLSSAQVLLTETNSTGGDLSRFVLATAQGNSGALVYFVPATNGSKVGLTMDQASLVSTAGDYNQTGTQGLMTLNGEAQLGVAIVGAVRAIRDYTEGNGLMHEIFNYTVSPASNSTYLELNRFPINGSLTYQLAMVAESGSFNITPSNNGTYTPPTVLFSSGNTANSTMNIRWTYSTNETAVPGLPASELFLSAVPTTNSATNNTTSSNSSSAYISTDALSAALQGLADGQNSNGNGVSFLTYRDKFTAGAWRFLTYFGRDTLISARLLLPLLDSSAVESVLGAVLERLSTTGEISHEETIGDYASFININNNQSYLGATPFQDYKMIDSNLLALPLMADYFLDSPQGQGQATNFLARNATLQNGTFSELAVRNVDFVMNVTMPFAQNATWENLYQLKSDQPVGNWRDSNTGLGYGRFPLDVNTALVPACLRAIARLSAAGIIPASYEQTATSYAAVWETQAPPLFEVSVPIATAQQRLQNYIQFSNLSTTLLTNSSTTNTTGSSQNITFQALSLSENGTTVEVMNSDPGFALYYGTNVSESLIQEVVQLMQPYPQGLLTNVGMVVANDAYDSNTTNYDIFTNAYYHGSVVWGWQQAIIAGGIAKQLWYCDNTTTIIDYVRAPDSPPSWCNNTQLVAQLKQAQTNLWQSIEGARDYIFSEVWSPVYDNATSSFVVANLQDLSSSSPESDAIQLWSYGFLAQFDPTTNSTTGSIGANSTSPGASAGMTMTSLAPSTMSATGSGTASMASLPTTAVSTPEASLSPSFPTTTALAFARRRD